jgi:hypothetical protein
LLLEDEGFSVQGLEGWWGKKRSRSESEGSSHESSPPTSPPHPNPTKEWKNSKLKMEDLLALVNSGFLRKRRWICGALSLVTRIQWRKIQMKSRCSARFVERRLVVPTSDFFKGLLRYYVIEYLNLNPNDIFHVSVFVHFCEAFVGIKPHWVLFWKFFRVKPQPSTNDPRVVGGAGI